MSNYRRCTIRAVAKLAADLAAAKKKAAPKKPAGEKTDKKA